MIWSDVEHFLRSPGVVIEHLQARLRGDASDAGKNRDRLRRLRTLLDGKGSERNKVVGLYRKGLLNDAELTQQLGEIDKEAAGLAAQIEEMEQKLAGVDESQPVLENAEALLMRLRERLDGSLTWERKRQLVELLVGGIRIETLRDSAKPENVVTVTYRFPSVVAKCTGMRAYVKSDVSIKPECRA
jgi:hypothetical protein